MALQKKAETEKVEESAEPVVRRRERSFYGAAAKLLRARDPQIIISGPAETGKTLAALHKLDSYAWEYPGFQGAIVRKVRVDMDGSVLQTFKQKVLPEDTPVKTYGGEKPEFFDYPNGSRIWVGGMDKPGKVLSSERDAIYVNQAEELTEVDWQTLSTRTTGRASNMPFAQLFGDCNPGSQFHWIKLAESEGRLRLLESRHEDNPTLFDPETGKITEQGKRSLEALDKLTGVLKERLRYGRWAAAEGIVYDGWDRAIHYIDKPYTELKSYVAGVDWGFTNPGVISVWGIDSDKRMYRVCEYYHSKKLVASSSADANDGWWIEKALGVKREFNPTFLCDPSEPGYIKTFRNAGLNCIEAFNDISLGIQNVQQRMKVQADGRARLYIVKGTLRERDADLAKVHKPTCTEEEIEAYVWPKGSDGKPLKEVPVDDNNHAMDAMRYACAYVDGMGRKQVLYA